MHREAQFGQSVRTGTRVQIIIRQFDIHNTREDIKLYQEHNRALIREDKHIGAHHPKMTTSVRTRASNYGDTNTTTLRYKD
jgi:hypothetical protein